MSINNEAELVLRRKRRAWTLDEKRRIVDESRADGASIGEVARRYDLNGNQLLRWRRQFGVEPTALQDLAAILPVTTRRMRRRTILRQGRPARWKAFSARVIGLSCGPMS